MTAPTEITLVDREALFTAYHETRSIEAVVQKSGYSKGVLRRLADEERWDERIAAMRAGYIEAATDVAAKAARSMVLTQIANAGELYTEAKEMQAASLKIEADVRALPGVEPVDIVRGIDAATRRAEAATKKRQASSDIAEKVKGWARPDAAPDVAVQVNVDARPEVRVLTADDLRKLPDAALAALDLARPAEDAADAS